VDGMTASLSIFYLYRDAANNKRHGNRIIGNPSGISPDRLWNAFANAFLSNQLFPDIVSFDPSRLGWDELFFPGHDLAVCDVSLHELDRVVASEDEPNVDESADDLIRKLAALAP
jgi:hypothetical protein